METELTALQQDVTYLMDRTAISDCIARHARGCDRHDSELIKTTYHSDGVDEHGNVTNLGVEYGDWANRTHASTSRVHTHNITTHSCEIDGDNAHAESYVIVGAAKSRRPHRSVHQRSICRPTGAAGQTVAHSSSQIDGRGDVSGRRVGATVVIL